MSVAVATESGVTRAKPRGQTGGRTREWVMADPTISGLLAGLPDMEVIPLPLIRDRVGWNRDGQSLAVKQGVIRPVEKRGPAGCYQVTREDAIEILIAAALAFAAGVAIVVMLRAIKGAGLDASVLAQSVT
jgi:hypothetical protein